MNAEDQTELERIENVYEQLGCVFNDDGAWLIAQLRAAQDEIVTLKDNVTTAYMAGFHKRDDEVNELKEENERLKAGLETIIKMVPCTEGGGCFWPMHDGDGEYIGEQQVDPLTVIQGMQQTAQDTLSPQPQTT